MKLIFFVSFLLLTLAEGLNAKTLAGEQDDSAAKAVIRDLQQIVAPSGIQTSYKAKIGGVPQ